MQYTKEEIAQTYQKLTERAYAAKEGTPGARFEVLREAMQFFDVLQHGKGVPGADLEAISSTSLRVRNNLTRLIGYKPSMVEGFEFKPDVARDVAYFAEHVEKVEKTLQEGNADGLQERIASLAKEYEQAEKGWTQGERKRARKHYKTLTEALPGTIENAIQFGYPPGFKGTYVLQSDDECLGSLQKLVDDHPTHEEELRFLIDKNHEGHPFWFVYMFGTDKNFVRTATIFSKPLIARGESGPIDVRLPIVHCHGYESQFDGLPKYQEAYIENLVPFLRSDAFTVRTSYRAVALMDIKRDLPKEQVARLGLQKLERVKSATDGWMQPWGVTLDNHKEKLSLGVPAKKHASMLGGDLRMLEMMWNSTKKS